MVYLLASILDWNSELPNKPLVPVNEPFLYLASAPGAAE